MPIVKQKHGQVYDIISECPLGAISMPIAYFPW